MPKLSICVFLLLFIQYAVEAASSATFTPTSTDNLTCPSRTINYLTHTLLQQCLPSSRTNSIKSNYASSSTTKSRATTNTPAPSSGKVSISTTAVSHSKSSSTDSISTIKSSTTSSLSTSIRSVTTISAVTANSLVPVLPEPADEDSPLESGNFLSFEEWKKQNLIKAGQSEHLGRNSRGEQQEPRKRPGSVHNTLDSLGDDAEIDLDFSGFVPGGPDTIIEQTRRLDGTSNDDQEAADSDKLKKASKGKEAGTTSKERFNYASFDCAANVLKTNPEAKSPNTVLSDNKDSYMLNKCSAKNKFIIIELCDDILIDTIVLANFEFFSSSFRTVRASVSDRYPVKIDKWKTVGTFEARNTREVQAFLVETPLIWARYVRFDFLTHYGNEFYCPVSIIRVHGISMMEEYKHDLETSLEDDDEDETPTETEPEIVEPSRPVAEETIVETTNHSEAIRHSEDDAVGQPSVETILSAVFIPQECNTDNSEELYEPVLGPKTSPNDMFVIQRLLSGADLRICFQRDESIKCKHNFDSLEVTNRNFLSESTLQNSRSTVENAQSTNHSKESRSSTTPHAQSIKQPERNVSVAHRDAKSTPSQNHSSDSKKSTSTGSGSSKTSSSTRDATRSTSVKQSGSGTQPQPAGPTMQESFFKSVQKRLQMLESNSSLSLLYIEEQSRALRDAFKKVEQRQLIKTSTFLEQLNQTVLNELREFRQQYDQLWQSTVIELELQRERYQLESQAMHARLGVLAEELIFQRRVSILQMILILVCLGLVLFSRGALHSYMELPLVQSVLSRSPSSKWIPLSSDSNANTPAMQRTRSAHEVGSKHGILKRHVRGISEDSNNEGLSASEMYSPPTPISFDGYSDAEMIKTESRTDDPDFDPASIERPSTSPPTLPSTEGLATPTYLNSMHDVSIDGRILPQMSGTEDFNTPPIKVGHASPAGGRHLTWDLPE